MILVGIFIYLYGIRMANKLKSDCSELYQRYGSPSFYYAGPDVYGFIFSFILFGKYKRENIDEPCKKIISIYRYAIICELLLFLSMFVLLGGQSQ